MLEMLLLYYATEQYITFVGFERPVHVQYYLLSLACLKKKSTIHKQNKDISLFRHDGYTYVYHKEGCKIFLTADKNACKNYFQITKTKIKRKNKQSKRNQQEYKILLRNINVHEFHSHIKYSTQYEQQ